MNKDIRCANYLNPQAMKETIDEWESQWTLPEDRGLRVPNIEVCLECDYGLPVVSQLMQTVKAASGDLGVKVAQDVKRMTDEPIQRVCYKALQEEKETSNE